MTESGRGTKVTTILPSMPSDQVFRADKNSPKTCSDFDVFRIRFAQGENHPFLKS